jgi:hypothetical protein
MTDEDAVDGEEWVGEGGCVFATLLAVSIGLCGVNYVAWTVAMSVGARPDTSHWVRQLGGTAMITGMIELVGMAVGAVGLVVVGLVALVIRTIRKDG